MKLFPYTLKEIGYAVLTVIIVYGLIILFTAIGDVLIGPQN